MSRVTHLLQHRVTLQRPARFSDDVGGAVIDYERGDQIEGLPARVFALSQAEVLVGAAREALITHHVLMEASVEVQRGDRIIPDFDPSIYLEVISVRRPSMRISHLRLNCEEHERAQQTNTF